MVLLCCRRLGLSSLLVQLLIVQAAAAGGMTGCVGAHHCDEAAHHRQKSELLFARKAHIMQALRSLAAGCLASCPDHSMNTTSCGRLHDCAQTWALHKAAATPAICMTAEHRQQNACLARMTSTNSLPTPVMASVPFSLHMQMLSSAGAGRPVLHYMRACSAALHLSSCRSASLRSVCQALEGLARQKPQAVVHC